MKLAAAIALLSLTGCTLTVSSDGSKSATIDGAAIAKILAEK